LEEEVRIMGRVWELGEGSGAMEYCPNNKPSDPNPDPEPELQLEPPFLVRNMDEWVDPGEWGGCRGSERTEFELDRCPDDGSDTYCRNTPNNIQMSQCMLDLPFI
jgi:hypothetical protein